MNLELFNKLMEQPPDQHLSEWLAFLEISENYLIKHKIEHPVVVEIGILYGRQKQFYEKLFGAEHIGIDITDKGNKPDILGDSHAPQTMQELHRMLYGRKIDILFIDGDHRYEAVKEDFNLYSLLCNGIVAFHDIDLCRIKRKKSNEVWKLWNELEMQRDRNSLFISIRERAKVASGIGMVIKK